MTLKHTLYTDLNSRQREIYNFQKVAAILADYGFNCIKLADDWQGADFLAYRFDGNNTLKVQLKGRLSIEKKYKGKNLFMTFPCKGSWYLVEHDQLVDLVEQNANWLNTTSWKDRGIYNSAAPNKHLLEALKNYKLEALPYPDSQVLSLVETEPPSD